jgi:hypothetical protein
MDIGIPVHTDPLNIVQPLHRESRRTMRARGPNDEQLLGERLVVPFDEYRLVAHGSGLSRGGLDSRFGTG